MASVVDKCVTGWISVEQWWIDTGRDTCPSATSSIRNLSERLTWNRNRASIERGRRRTAWAKARTACPSVGTSLTSWHSAPQLSRVTLIVLSLALFDSVSRAATWRRCVKLHVQRAGCPQSDTLQRTFCACKSTVSEALGSTHGQLTLSSRTGKNSFEFWGLYNGFVGHSGPKYAAVKTAG